MVTVVITKTWYFAKQAVGSQEKATAITTKISASVEHLSVWKGVVPSRDPDDGWTARADLLPDGSITLDPIGPGTGGTAHIRQWTLSEEEMNQLLFEGAAQASRKEIIAFLDKQS